MTRVNGRAIEDYKRFEIRETGLAVPKAEPLYIPAISNGYAPHDFIVDSSLVLNLPLYLLKGSKFKSVDRYQISPTLTEALWRPNGRLFDGSNDQILIGYPTHLRITANFTVEGWVNITNLVNAGAGNHTILGRSDGIASKVFYLNVQSSGAVILVTHGTTVGSPTSAAGLVSAGTWYHVAGVYSHNTYARVFLDGVQKAEDTSVSDVPNPAQNIYVGWSYSTNFLYGLIGEVRMYNRALADVEITHNYNATRFRYQ